MINPSEIADKINITLVINYSITYRQRDAFQFSQEVECFQKVMDFWSFVENKGRNISKNLSSRYSQKILDYAKQSAVHALKTC